MRLIIFIDTGNDAFQPDPAPEVSRLLSVFAEGCAKTGLPAATETRIQDINGNVCGLVLAVREGNTGESLIKLLSARPPFGQEETIRLHVSDWNYQDKCYDATEEVLREFRDKVSKYGEDGKDPTVRGRAWDWFIRQIDFGTVKRSYGIEDAVLFFDYNNPAESVSEWDL